MAVNPLTPVDKVATSPHAADDALTAICSKRAWHCVVRVCLEYRQVRCTKENSGHTLNKRVLCALSCTRDVLVTGSCSA